MNERMQRYTESMRGKGFVLVSVWIPEGKVLGLRKTAEKWRRDAGHVTTRADRIYRKRRSSK